MQGIHISAMGCYLPAQVVKNQDFERLVETSDEWIVSHTGVRERRVSSGEPTWWMGVLAARDALERGKIDAASIDLILFTTVTPEYYTPALACIAQAHLGAHNAFALDLNCACSGFVAALDMARRYLYTGGVDRVLIISAERLSAITDYTDRSTCVLFGDGASACVVERGEGLYSSHLSADGMGASSLYAAHGEPAENPFADPALAPEMPEIFQGEKLHMNGREVYRFATKTMAQEVRAACFQAGIEVEEIDLVIPHQANVRIVETAMKLLGLPMERAYLNLEQLGNTSSASIPLAMDEALQKGAIQPGMLVCAVGFGAGLTSGAVLLRWE
ncbi:ketoacyl-ACP synthase III [Phocea massiliensis]|jgi:3-oxoacyl-[acyl-carrier-protein] synthase-3|uniref:3-oxoacyl-ACP synthase III family protein n=1 Tax=Merdimmobilis hominis TaxID=2897707 RepID=UPI0006C78CF4|nr:beta-ketoacyl-ACP synthase III [Merdimmobilis hominis]MCD4835411.1 ketoacyl-ACP synthase III [Merdimmobilis hominis]PWL60915.1 MAG: ketoacyl-ACP synthase III [Oscillospiraceae bacterium]